VTHEVFNQSTPWQGRDLLAANRPLQDALAAFAPGLARAPLHALAVEAGSAAMQAHARLAHRHAPVLHTHDRHGVRIDEVEFHPSYHALLGRALAHGLHGAPWVDGAASGEPHAHVRRAAGFMLFTEAEPSVLCPVSMTYAATPALRDNAALQAAFGRRLGGREYDPRLADPTTKSTITMGMGMTEKQGGSDVRANTTRAVADGEDGWGRRFRLSGHKWFFSAPMCDAFLVLAQADAGPSCFFVPRVLPDGRRNALSLMRLKHKLGNHANASSEVEFDGTFGWLVGEPGRGVPQILAMGALTRLDCALGTAGLMRAALSQAIHHARQRRAFGKVLASQPLMQAVLADLALESEAAGHLAMRLAATIDHTEGGRTDAHETAMRRLLTPVAKFWVCKRGSAFVQEAMECLGGNGYVEADGEGTMARIYREMPLNSIWEGSGNIMALDLLRALRSGDAVAALEHETAAARGAHRGFDRARAALLAAIDATIDEASARRIARQLALLSQAALMHRLSTPEAFAAFCDTRLDGAADVFGLLDHRHDPRALIDRALPPGFSEAAAPMETPA
jgi:putative acyl-CoA dehydrogenase